MTLLGSVLNECEYTCSRAAAERVVAMGQEATDENFSLPSSVATIEDREKNDPDASADYQQN